MSDYSEDAWRESFGSSEQGSTGLSGEQSDVLNSTGAMAYGGRRRRSRKHRASHKKRKTHRRKSRGGRRHKRSHRRH
jgi:hypothetical protein